tara:strand:+ start:11670 stop:11903 length:234 start_codon:yes stop_codon:yes gene_type:complete
MQDKILKIDISKAMSICLRDGVRVYPIVSGRLFKIEVDNKGELKRYAKEVVAAELNKALATTYKHFAVEIIKKNQCH